VDFRPIPNGDGINSAHTRELANSFLVDAFYSHEVFKKLPIELVEELLQHMKPVTLKIGEVLFQAGDQGTNMFVVHTGSIACINTQGKEVKVLAQGTLSSAFVRFVDSNVKRAIMPSAALDWRLPCQVPCSESSLPLA